MTKSIEGRPIVELDLATAVRLIVRDALEEVHFLKDTAVVVPQEAGKTGEAVKVSFPGGAYTSVESELRARLHRNYGDRASLTRDNQGSITETESLTVSLKNI